MKHSTLTGKLALILAAFLWGISFVVVQKALNGGWTTFLLLGMRGLLAGSALTALSLHRKFWKNKALLRDGLIGGVLLFIGMVLQTYGQLNSTVSNSSFITVLYVVFIPLILWKKHPLNLSAGLAIVLAVSGTAILSLQSNLNFNIGDLLLVGCALTFAIHIIFMVRLATHNELIAATAIQCLTMAVLSFILASFEGVSIPSSGWIFVLYAGLVSSGLAFLLQLYGQSHVHPTISGLLLTLEALFGTLGAIFILKEPVTLRIILGGSLMICAVVVIEVGPMLWMRLKGETKDDKPVYTQTDGS